MAGGQSVLTSRLTLRPPAVTVWGGSGRKAAGCKTRDPSEQMTLMYPGARSWKGAEEDKLYLHRNMYTDRFVHLNNSFILFFFFFLGTSVKSLSGGNSDVSTAASWITVLKNIHVICEKWIIDTLLVLHREQVPTFTKTRLNGSVQPYF